MVIHCNCMYGTSDPRCCVNQARRAMEDALYPKSQTWVWAEPTPPRTVAPVKFTFTSADYNDDPRC